MKYLYHILASLPQRWTHLVHANTIIGGEVVNVAMHVTQISLKWHAYGKVFGKQYNQYNGIWFISGTPTWQTNQISTTKCLLAYTQSNIDTNKCIMA
jgi:hypothetical protein